MKAAIISILLAIVGLVLAVSGNATDSFIFTVGTFVIVALRGHGE